jgi:hypothetical protein
MKVNVVTSEEDRFLVDSGELTPGDIFEFVHWPGSVYLVMDADAFKKELVG